MIDKTLAEHARALAAGDYSSEELARAYLDRIRALDGRLNSLITVTEETALAQARAADERRARGEALGPLDGLPLVHKDIFCTDGVKTSCASRMLDNFIAPYNATVVARLGTPAAPSASRPPSPASPASSPPTGASPAGA